MELTVKEKIRTLAGKGAWHNEDLDGKLPSVHLSDGPHGLRKQNETNNGINDSIPATCYPTASALACSWDLDAIKEMAESLGKEAWNMDVSVLLGPGVNMKRSPLCGRNFEYFSEDPFLAGKIATTYVNAVQEQGVGTSLKHFAANSQETVRMTSNSVIDERTLREIYLAAFEMTVKNAQPATIMASYNMINGAHSTENKRLLTDILRNEWGFKGLVMSDWGACSRLSTSVKAGQDLDMPGTRGEHQEKCIKDFEEGLITEDEINVAAERMMALVDKYNYKKSRTRKPCDHHKAAVDVAKKCAVLLKNDGILPLEGAKKVTVIGELARTMRFQGGGSSHINVPEYKNAIKALEELGISVEFAPGYHVKDDIAEIALEMEAEDVARVAAQEGRPVLFFGGLTDIAEGEGYDRTTLAMPQNQVRLFDKIYAANDNIIYVSFSGAPYTVPFATKVRAMLHMYLCGEATGEASVSILTGETNPSGKLAETFPVDIEDTPACGSFGTREKNVDYSEGVLIGYRYYDTKHMAVEYPFGFGLSYTNFEYEDLRVRKGEKPLEYTVTFKIRNIGERDGYEAAQIYVGNPGELRPVKELKGFAKPFVKKGETVEVSVTLDARSFAIYDVLGRSFAVPEGNYQILVGASSRDIRLTGNIAVAALDAEGASLPVITADRAAESMKTKLYLLADGTEGDPFFSFDKPGIEPYTLSASLSELSKDSPLARKVMKSEEEKIRNNNPDRKPDDPEMLGWIAGMKESTLDCCTNNSGGSISYALAERIVKQANKNCLKRNL